MSETVLEYDTHKYITIGHYVWLTEWVESRHLLYCGIMTPYEMNVANPVANLAAHHLLIC